MFRKIFSKVSIVFVLVVGASLVSAQKPGNEVKVFKANERFVHHQGAQSRFGGDGVKGKAKTDVGMDKMCLALDLQEARLTIEEVMEDPEIEDSEKVDWVVESIDSLLYHLEGTKDGDKLIELLENDEATIEDYLEAVNETQRSLQKNLKGEERWAFNVGLEMCNVYMESNSGTGEALKNSLKKLEKLVAEAPKYLTGEEIKVFKEIVQFANKQTLEAEDYVAIQDGLDNFVTIYFKTAS